MTNNRIILGVGANLVPDGYGSVVEGLAAAIAMLGPAGVEPVAQSRWFETAPVPISDQPWFVNAVIVAQTRLTPLETLKCLHAIESRFGRTRTIRNEARVLDIDLLDYAGLLHDDDHLTLPHPRMHERAFVLLPLRDVAPDWQHPMTTVSLAELIDQLPPEQQIRVKDE